MDPTEALAPSSDQTGLFEVAASMTCFDLPLQGYEETAETKDKTKLVGEERALVQGSLKFQ